MSKVFTLLMGVLCVFQMQAQSLGNITGTIYDADNQAALYANVILQSPADSSMIKGEITDENGAFKFTGVAHDSYQLMVSYIGFDNYYSEVFDLNTSNYEMPSITLQASGTRLEEVTVTAQRPMIEMKSDKVVFNVSGTVNSSGDNGLELLRKSPGVMIDNNENINVLGKSGVRILIDGKESPLTGEDLAAFLKSLQADQIDAIEIITNPSAKYDAEGNAGIINIRLKRDQNMGANANINLGASQGQKFQANGSVSGNYRNKKTNVFGNYGYNNGQNTNYMRLYREQDGMYFDNNNDMLSDWEGHNYKFGTDYFINKKNTIGFLVNGSMGTRIFTSDSNTPIGMIGATEPDRILMADSESDMTRNNHNFNLNYQFDNGKERTLNVDLDYGQYRNESDDFQPNTYTDRLGNVEEEIINATDSRTDIDIYTLKADYEQPAFKGKLGVGIKNTYITTDNTFMFYNVYNGVRQFVHATSNIFDYTENVNAAYVNYNTQIKKVGINAGVRAEQTNWKGDLMTFIETGDRTDKNSYINFFPSAGVSWQANEKNSFNLSYSRRINRPSYQDLNPFRSQLDILTFEKGNPFLRPEYTNQIQLRHSFNYSLNTTLSYSRTNDVITRLVDIDEDNPDASFITWENIANQNHYSLNVAAPIPFTDWWSSYTSLTLFHLHNNADFGDGKIIDVRATSLNGYSQQTFKLPKDISLEVSGWFVTPSVWGGNMQTNAMGSMDIGVQKRILNNKGKLKISLSDVFKTNAWSGESRLGELYMDANGGWDSRRVKVNFSYMIGNEKVKSRNRKTGLEDESKRVKSDN